MKQRVPPVSARLVNSRGNTASSSSEAEEKRFIGNIETSQVAYNHTLHEVALIQTEMFYTYYYL